MEEQDLNRLYSQLQQQVRGSQEYNLLLQAIADANEKMAQLNTRDRFLRAPLMKEQDKRELLGLFARIGRAAEPLISNAPNGPVKKLVNQIGSLAAGEHRAILNYDPAKPKTLSAVLDDVRTLTIDTRGLKLKDTVGGNASTRQPLTFIDDRGNEITGVFTKKQDFNLWADMEAGLGRIADKVKSQEGKNLIRSILPRLREGNEDIGVGYYSENNKNMALADFLSAVMRNKSISRDLMKEKLGKLLENELDGARLSKKLNDKTILEIADLFAENGNSIIQCAGMAGIQDGTRIDTRDAAVSAVADLLGMPKVVARSKPMNIITPEGVIEGTFMEEAKGEDPSNLTEEALNMSRECLSAESPEGRENTAKALKSASDLMVLDFITGNVDRHDRNMFYSMNTDIHKIREVQGIDNGCSLGVTVPKHGQGVKELTGTDYMMMVSRSTYDKVMALDPEALKFSLRGFGLSEQELNAAAERLNVLKQAFREKGVPYNGRQPSKNGSITIVDDDRLKEINMDKLGRIYPTGVPANLFGHICAGFTSYKDDYIEQSSENPVRRVLRSTPAEAANRGKITSRRFEGEQARSTFTLLDERQDRNRPSNSYNALMEAARAYKEAQTKLNERLKHAADSLKNEALAAEYSKATAENRPVKPLPEGVDPDYTADPDALYDATITSGDLLELKQLGRKLNEAANNYLNAGDDKGKNSKRRREAAKAAAGEGERSMNISEEELDTAERNERRALDLTNRRVGDALEAGGWKEGEAAPLASDANVGHISVRDEDNPDPDGIENNLITM